VLSILNFEENVHGGELLMVTDTPHYRASALYLLPATVRVQSSNRALKQEGNRMESWRLTVHIMAAMAEHEAGAISARTKAALAAAKARGTKLGGYRGDLSSVANKGNVESARVRSASATKRAGDLLPVIEDLKTSGAASLHQIAAGLNERGIKTARGGNWSAEQVRRVLKAAR
jgi:DNA invertase Pin-like site-specific DNA recombinase